MWYSSNKDWDLHDLSLNKFQFIVEEMLLVFSFSFMQSSFSYLSYMFLFIV